MEFVIGIDGGGTRTTVAVADPTGDEILRHSGAAGLVDPRRPEAAAERLAGLVREAVREADLEGPAAALCAGLAGVGSPTDRAVVQRALEAAGVARRVTVVCDGEIALAGALGGGAGILMIGGTGSIAWARAEDGRMERCGGWGMVVGDEGSGYAIGRDALRAALRGLDGRGGATRLLPAVLERLGIDDPREVPSWAGRADKAEIAALTPLVVGCADEGDEPAQEILRTAAYDQAAHAAALIERLDPWREDPRVVFFGGVFGNPRFAVLVADAMAERIPRGFRIESPAEDAVSGALRIAAQRIGVAVK